MTEPFKFVVSNDPAKARQAIGTLGVPTDYLTDNSGDYMVNDVVRYTDPAPSPTTDLTGLYACITDHTVGSPKDFPSRWRLVAAGSWSGLAGKPAVIAAGASAAAARAAVGASAVGDAVFTAADEAAARGAIGALGLVQADARFQGMSKRARNLAGSTRVGRSSSVACKYRRTAVAASS